MRALVETVSSWWSGISQREQHLLLGGAVLLVIASVYWGVIQPMSERAALAQARISSEKQLLSWVSDKADTIVELRKSGGVVVSNKPLNQVVSSTVKNYQIELIRMQPRDEMLQVWVKPVVFNQLVFWLANLKSKHGVDVEFMDISGTDTKGMVEVKRLQLKRGG